MKSLSTIGLHFVSRISPLVCIFSFLFPSLSSIFVLWASSCSFCRRCRLPIMFPLSLCSPFVCFLDGLLRGGLLDSVPSWSALYIDPLFLFYQLPHLLFFWGHPYCPCVGVGCSRYHHCFPRVQGWFDTYQLLVPLVWCAPCSCTLGVPAYCTAD